MPNDAPGEDEQQTTAKSTAREKKHPCPLCDKTFTRPSTLRVHLNTHTGAMPYVCEYPGCGRAFNVKSNMQRHFRSHGHVGASGLRLPVPVPVGPDGYTLMASSGTEQPRSFADPERQSATTIPLAQPPDLPTPSRCAGSSAPKTNNNLPGFSLRGLGLGGSSRASGMGNSKYPSFLLSKNKQSDPASAAPMQIDSAILPTCSSGGWVSRWGTLAGKARPREG